MRPSAGPGPPTTAGASPAARPSASPVPAPPNKLADDEVDAILDVLRSPRFVDCSPAQVYFTLLDEGVYLASESSFYRILRVPRRGA